MSIKVLNAFHSHIELCIFCARNPLELCIKGKSLYEAELKNIGDDMRDDYWDNENEDDYHGN